MATVTSNKFKSTTIYGTLSVIDNPNGNIISNTSLTGNLTVGGKINNIPVATIEYVSNLTSDAQAQINTKAPLASPTFTGTVSGITKTMVGLSNADNTTDLLKPISTATQTALNLKAPLESPSFTGSVNGITKAMVGLSNADNTTDLLKPISTATQTALNLLGGLSTNNAWSGTNTFNLNIPTTTLTPSLSSQFITKAYADTNYAGTGILSGTNSWTGTNTYNTNLPTSTLTPTTTSHLTNKAYVDLKAPLASPTFTGTVSGITKSMVGLSNADNTTDLLKPLSTATTNALILKAPLASPTFTGTLTTAGLTATGSTSLQTTLINGLTATASTSLQGTTINGLTVTAPTSLQGTTINGTCVNTGTLSTYGMTISTTNGLTTPIVNLSDYNLGTVYNGAIFQQNQNMTIRSWNSGTSDATNIYFTTMNPAHQEMTTMILYNNAIHLNQPTTIAGATTISGMLGLGGAAGRRFQISESLGGITMYIEDTGNMYTAGTFASGNASVGTLECWGNITSREGIYIYPGKSLTANGPINAYSGLNVYTGSTALLNTTIAGNLSLQSSNSLLGTINLDTGNNMLFSITNGAAFNFKFSGITALALSYTNATFNNIVSCPTLNVTGDITTNTIKSAFAESYQLKITDVINCNVIQKVAGLDTGGFLKIYENATLNDNILLGSTTSSVNIQGRISIHENLTLCSGTTSPTTGQLGEKITGSISLSVSSSVTSTISTITLTPGTWIIDGQVSFQSSSAVAYQINSYTVAFSKSSAINSTGMAQKSIYGNNGVVAYTGFGNIQYGQLFSESLQQVDSQTANTT